MIDITKRYRTRRGGEVLAIVQDDDALHILERWKCAVMHLRLHLNGHYNVSGCGDTPYDLIEVRKVRRWTLTETGEEPRKLELGEVGLRKDGTLFQPRNGQSAEEYRPFTLVESEVEL